MGIKNIMIIEDERTIREGMSDALECEGFHVVCACNGRDALNQLSVMDECDLPGCIFLDIMMPVMDGFTFLDEIEHRPKELADIPVCITSANFDAKKANLHPAVVEMFKKPFDLDQIFESAYKYCGHPGSD